MYMCMYVCIYLIQDIYIYIYVYMGMYVYIYIYTVCDLEEDGFKTAVVSTLIPVQCMYVSLHMYNI